ncbi:hypothetical protein STENM223S_09599 [Streptomyces tendae]
MVSSSGYRYMLIAVDSCGVYPTNQADLLPSVVPVLPATSRPGSWALVPVPFSTTVFRTSVTLSATFAVKACFSSTLCV